MGVPQGAILGPIKLYYFSSILLIFIRAYSFLVQLHTPIGNSMFIKKNFLALWLNRWTVCIV